MLQLPRWRRLPAHRPRLWERKPRNPPFRGASCPLQLGGHSKSLLVLKTQIWQLQYYTHSAPADAENSRHTIFGDVTGPAPARVMSTPGLFTGHFSLTLQSAKRYSVQAAASQVKTLNCHALLLHLTHGLQAATACEDPPGAELERGNKGPLPRPTAPTKRSQR